MKTLTLILAAAFVALSTATMATAASQPDFTTTVDAIEATMEAHHFDPVALETGAYKKIRKQAYELAATAQTALAFAEGYNKLWADGPFSHVQLSIARGSADDLAGFLDQMNAGPDAVQLRFDGDTAILAVHTMMGRDTITAIEKAYGDIAARGAKALVIDLRTNQGGAFAVLPLVSHLISKPQTMGVFVGRPWTDAHSNLPTGAEMHSVQPWRGWSIRAFWQDVTTQPLVRLQFDPAAPRFNGPVYVLASRKTASAAELAIDALQSAGRVTLVGETTAGALLSQKMFDVAGGFHLSLPIAGYVSAKHGVIEGKGLTPDIAVPAEQALETALAHLKAN